MERYAEFFAQPLGLFGAGARRKLMPHLRAFSPRRVLLCTDAGLMAAGIASEMEQLLRETAAVDVVVFDGVVANPTEPCVRQGVAMYKEHGCDMILSLGGGSAHDAAKAIALMAVHEGTVWDYVGLNKLRHPLPPLVAVNTTAGTGSDVTRFAVITHVEKRTKLTIVDRRLTPLIAVNDPELMVGLPPTVTVHTGIDALTHAVEAYLSRMATPLSDACALKAVKLIAEYLPRAYARGTDMTARAAMAYAQYLAGIATNNAGAGAVHAMAHQLGGFYNLPHGLCNAVLLPWVLEYNAAECAERLMRVGEAMRGPLAARSVLEGAQRAIEVVRDFERHLDVPNRLGLLDVKAEDMPAIAQQAMEDPTVLTNPRRATASDLEQILKAAL
ncbi:iron-containing alcohol dehydrogenase [Desulfosoma caldarium]|uniref:Alcohol dehydrogenase n=1 Tax=Desulfosoma caldarium TaxID=610254 RepID=A0A3N1UVD1_9BACT|nr:iron-containing alcohol dehydrogenase [Desulfosoma caldarium]ROQ93618.1 alcohol dehydrogenase [Desulfosoma caldarium]